MSNPIQSLGNDASALARSVVQSTEHAAQQGLDSLESARTQTGAALKQFAHDTESLAHRGMDAVRDGAEHMRERSSHAKDSTTHYIQHEPLKSVLMAAAVGAALMGLVALLSKHSGPSR